MLGLILRRIGAGVVTLWVVTVILFLGTEILPGDVAEAVLGQSATPETVKALREEVGLDRPPLVRYVDWMAGLARLDFGKSLANTGVSVSDLIKERIDKTLMLAALTAVIAVPLALALGLLAAARPGSLVDRVVSSTSLALAAVPEFFIATLLVLVFAVKLRWLPAISYVTEFRSFGQLFSSLLLPVLTLSGVIVSQMARMTRATIIDVLEQPYIEMAMLKGIPRWRIILVHALRNAIGPIANVIALNLAYLVSGVVIVETIFSYPGLARLIVDAVSTRDYPVILACAVLFCSAYVILMLIADIAAILGNPRLKHRR